MRFGERVRQLRKDSGMGQRALAQLLGVSFTYISKIENGKLDFGDYPSEALIQKLAHIFEIDEDCLLLLAKKVPRSIKERVFERPDAFQRFATLDDKSIDMLLGQLDE
ncbi:MAG: helix-turn-helix transcriptional regulator [Planctomycetota bacterium]